MSSATSGIRALALETTSRRGEVALIENGLLLAQRAFEAGTNHTAGLLPLIQSLCAAAGWRARDVGEVYVSAGPGGFTGTRVGITFAKTLAFATGARVVAVPTPRVLVEEAPPAANHALVVIDARRGMAWIEGFSRAPAGAAGQDRPWRPAGKPSLTTLADALARAPRPVWLLGEGVAYHAAAIDPADQQVHALPDVRPRAAVVASVGWAMARAGAFADPFALAPVYVRRPEAEERRMGLA